MCLSFIIRLWLAVTCWISWHVMWCRAVCTCWCIILYYINHSIGLYQIWFDSNFGYHGLPLTRALHVCIAYPVVLELDHLLWYVASYVGFMSHIIWDCDDTSLAVIAIMACRVVSYNSSLYAMTSCWMLRGSPCALYDIVLASHCWLFVLIWLHIMWYRNVCIHCDIVCWRMAYYMNWILHIQSISLPTICNHFQMMAHHVML